MSKQKYVLQNPRTLTASTAVKVTLTMVAGIAIALIITPMVRQQYFDSLTQRVETVSTLLSEDRITSVIKQDDSAKENERYLKNQLQRAREVNNDTEFVYLMTGRENGDLYFIVDSEPVGTADYSPFGQTFTEASPALKEAFASSTKLVEGPVSDRWGNWLSVLVPVYSDKREQIAFVGMDIPASTYNTLMLLVIATPITVAALISMVFIAGGLVRKRRRENLRMRSELVSIASHELRTPLTGVRWGEEMLLEQDLDERNQQIIQAMYDSTIRLQESIEDILQLANWQSGRSNKLVKTSTDLSDILRGIIATQKLPAKQKSVSLELDQTWPDKLILDIDGQRMKRVFNNLMSNAIKYSKPHTSVVIGYEKIDGKHTITIRDHGIGIPAHEQAKVFDGFYRASNAISYEVGGTGMGLFMSRDAVEQHGGTLWLRSKEDEGTTVYIQLP